MGRISKWWERVKIAVYLIAGATAIAWYSLRRAYRRGVMEGDAERGYRDSSADVRAKAEAGDVDAMREDLLKKARRK